MKHVKALSKAPTRAEDIPIEDIITFVTAVLTAIASLLSAKEQVG